VRGDGDPRAVGSLNGHQPTFKNTKISQNRPETRMLQLVILHCVWPLAVADEMNTLNWSCSCHCLQDPGAEVLVA
jgi:hypothetical protein